LARALKSEAQLRVVLPQAAQRLIAFALVAWLKPNPPDGLQAMDLAG
jgi:hypothetical protein